MINTILTVLIAVFAGLASVLPTTGKFIDKRFNGAKQIQPTGFKTILCICIVISLTALQSWLNTKDNENKEKAAQNDLNRRDSLQRIEIIESNLRTTEVLATTLGKYGFKLDSANDKLVKIVRDSSKTKVYLANNPVLDLCPDSSSISYKGTTNQRYTILLCSADAACSDIDIRVNIALQDTLNNLHKYTELPSPLLDRETIISTDNGVAVKIHVDNVTNLYKSMLFHFTGNYKNSDKSKTFSIDYLYTFNIKTNKNEAKLSGNTKKKVVDFMLGRGGDKI